jgi:hypothetical protein
MKNGGFHCAILVDFMGNPRLGVFWAISWGKKTPLVLRKKRWKMGDFQMANH